MRSVLSAIVVIAAYVHGADQPAAKQAEDMTVTATREHTTIATTPYYANVLNRTQLLLEDSARTLPEALKNETGTLVQKTGHGQGSPYIRGFTGFRNLFLIDGVRLNNSVFRDGPNQYWNTVDSFSLSRIEFVRGPFSVLYGSDAVGGTLNTITLGTADLRPGREWDRRAYYRYANAEDAHVGRVESIGFLSPSVALSLGYTIKSFGDLEGGRDVGTQEKTGYDEVDWDAKLEYFPNQDARLTLAHQNVNMDDAWRTHKTIYGIDWEGLSIGTDLRRTLFQDRKLTYLQYHQQNLPGLCSDVRLGISHHLQEEKRDRLRSSARHDIQGVDVTSLGAFAQLMSPSPMGDLVYGIEYYRDEVDSFKNTYHPDGSLKNTSIQGPVGDEASYDLLGVYAQNSVGVSDIVDVVVGARYDYAAADADAVQDPQTGAPTQIHDNWNSVVGSGRVLYHLASNNACNIFAGISQGFRAPNLSDLTRLDSARTDEIETPSPDLDPEHFVSYEIGVKAKNLTLSGHVAYFYTDIEDMIARTPTGRMIDDEYEVTKRNAGDGFVQGIEIQASCRLHARVTTRGAFTWMDGEIDTYPTANPMPITEPIDRLMPPTGYVAVRWQMNDMLWVEADCTAAATADKLSTRDQSDTSRIPSGGTPGYTVIDLRASCKVTDNVVVTVAVENVGDKDYRTHGSGINEPGRNLIVSTGITF